jgi:hypothetical protein
VPEVGSHGCGEREVLDRFLQVADLPRGQPPAELGVVVGRVGVDEVGETLPRGRVLAGVVLGPCQGLAEVAGRGFGGHSMLEHVDGRCRISAGQQPHPPLVPVVDIT